MFENKILKFGQTFTLVLEFFSCHAYKNWQFSKNHNWPQKIDRLMGEPLFGKVTSAEYGLVKRNIYKYKL